MIEKARTALPLDKKRERAARERPGMRLDRAGVPPPAHSIRQPVGVPPVLIGMHDTFRHMQTTTPLLSGSESRQAMLMRLHTVHVVGSCKLPGQFTALTCRLNFYGFATATRVERTPRRD